VEIFVSCVVYFLQKQSDHDPESLTLQK